MTGTPRLSRFSLSVSRLHCHLAGGTCPVTAPVHLSTEATSDPRPWAACCPRRPQQEGGWRPWELGGRPTWPGRFCSAPVEQGEPPASAQVGVSAARWPAAGRLAQPDSPRETLPDPPCRRASCHIHVSPDSLCVQGSESLVAGDAPSAALGDAAPSTAMAAAI